MNNRFVSTLAAGALVALALVATPAQAASAQADAGAEWLAGELANGRFDNGFGGSDYGLALDAYFALVAADANRPEQADIIAATRDDLKLYITGNGFGDDGPSNTESTYAGATAKALVAAQTAGKNPTSFGGVDLVERLESVTGSTGRIADDSDYGDYANVLGQSFAVQGLAAAGSDEADSARDFLVDQQCSDGSFRLALSGACTSDTDATATAVISLVAARGQGLDDVSGTISKATAWLSSEQAKNGSFGGGDPTTAEANSNSTGLAARALRLAGKTDQAAKAAAWISKLQVTTKSGAKLEADLGAIAKSPETFAAGKDNGITSTTRGEWKRSTAQALLGLIYLRPQAEPGPSTKVPKPVVRTVTKAGKATKVVVNKPAPVPDKPDSAAGRVGQFLAGAYSNGDHIEVKEGDNTFVDYDLTADSVLSLRQLGQQPAFAERATAFLLADGSIDSYAHGAPYEKDAAYADALAKLVIAGSLGEKPDIKVLKPLIIELTGLQQEDGSFQDKGKYADESGGAKRQAIAALALMMSGETEAADRAVEHIVEGQCTDGSFPEALGAACDTGDPVATGWALQAVNATTDGNRSATETLAEMPDGWDDDRAATVIDAATSLNDVVRVDGSVSDTDLASTAAIASGRQAAGLDAGPTAVYLAKLQKEDGGLPNLAGDKKSDVKSTIAASPALAPASILSAPGNGLTSALSMPMTVEQAPVTAPTAAPTDNDDLTISRPVAYAGGGIVVLLLIAALVWGLLGRRTGAVA